MGSGESSLPAIVTLKHTSQVCASWREIALSSPSIWGRVINVDCFQQKDHNWGSEVIRRTGQAPLYIRSRKQTSVGQLRMLETLFTDHWTRIRSIRLAVICPQRGSINASTWAAFGQPAPSLETFRLILVEFCPKIFSDDKFRLFANHAPQLHAIRTFGVKYSLYAPWLSNLRHLSLVNPFNLEELLHALVHMRYLETFTGANAPTTILDNDFSLPKVILSTLKSIDLSAFGGFEPCMILLDSITPSPACRLSLELSINTPISDRDATKIHSCLSRYSRDYFTSQFPERAVVTFGRLAGWGRRVFQVRSVFTSDPSLQFSFRITSELSTAMISLFLNPFLRSFSRTKGLNLKISDDTLSLGDPQFNSFISSFTKVEALKVETSDVLVMRGMNLVLKALLNLPKDISPVLPSLVELNCVGKQQPLLLLAFLRWRQELGLPIHTVEMRMQNQDFSCLEEINGLLVWWMVGLEKMRYVCGSGNPSLLVFKRD